MDLLRDLLAGLRLWGTARRLRERPDDGPAREVDLEGVVPEPLGLAQDQIGRLSKRRLAGAAAAQRGPVTFTVASSSASATHMSDGCTAMQASLMPRIAFMRLRPPMAEQPLP